MSEFSITVPSYNEKDALNRLLRSIVMAKEPRITEIVVCDHRSNDGTWEMLELFEKDCSIKIKKFREERDFGPGFTFADLRNGLVSKASNECVWLFDADFIIGPAFKHLLNACENEFGKDGVCSIGIPIQCPHGKLVTDIRGRVMEHGRVTTHIPNPRCILKSCCEYIQHGRYEKCVARIDSQRKYMSKIPTINSSLISANIKTMERLKLRCTMTPYQEMIANGSATKNWQEAFTDGDLSQMYANVEEIAKSTLHDGTNLIGQVFNIPNESIYGAS
jgi:glycosyltransferase involved in cell wall biosynthesis